MLKCDFNKVAKKCFHGFSPVNLLHIFKTPFTKSTSGWLLLNLVIRSYLDNDKLKLSEMNSM